MKMTKPVFIALGTLLFSACASLPEAVFHSYAYDGSGSLNPSTTAKNQSASSGTSLTTTTKTGTTQTNAVQHPESNPSKSSAESAPAKEEEKPSTPKPTSLVINEILYDTAGNETDGHQFVELYGTPKTSLNGYQVVFVNGDDGKVQKIVSLDENAFLSSEGIFVIADAKTGAEKQSFVELADWIENIDPQNGPDAVQLLDDQGDLIDAVAYGPIKVTTASNGLAMQSGSPAADVKEGHSLSRKEGINTHDNQNDFIELETPTPGAL